MHCPVCKSINLVMSERQSIEIDYCPECRGVWLDRGELDKIIEKSSNVSSAPRGEDPAPSFSGRPHSSDTDPELRYGGRHRTKKRESFLSELFDFG